jgi:peptidoglycan/LPS O-acetylase OafA/YrhL
LPGALANFALRYLVLALLAVAISSITYKLIEVPMQWLGHHIIKNRKKASAELL